MILMENRDEATLHGRMLGLLGRHSVEEGKEVHDCCGCRLEGCDPQTLPRSSCPGRLAESKNSDAPAPGCAKSKLRSRAGPLECVRRNTARKHCRAFVLNTWTCIT